MDPNARFFSLPDRCFELWCEGHSLSAIARRLDVDRQTVSRHVRKLHREAQVERRADRALALTRALLIQRRIQATAWEEIERQQQREDAALQPGAWTDDGGVERQTPYRAQVARLLNVILAAAREEARLERLYEKDAPARAGDGDTKSNQDAFFLMLRRSDMDELDRLGLGPRDDAPSAPHDVPGRQLDEPSAAPDRDHAAPADSTEDPSAVTPTNSGAPGSPAPDHAVPPGGTRPSGTVPPPDFDAVDDWYVHFATPPGAVPDPSLFRTGHGDRHAANGHEPPPDTP